MGHRDYKTTLIYADYAPRTHEKSLMERALSPAPSPFRAVERSQSYGPGPAEGTT